SIATTLVDLWATVGLIRGAWLGLNGSSPHFTDLIDVNGAAVWRLFSRQVVRHLARAAKAGRRIPASREGFDVGLFFGHAKTVANMPAQRVMLILWVVGISAVFSLACPGHKKSRGHPRLF
ncbi:MAG: hypothetical protein VXW25_02535, partial [Pseudomonadota bacterium]|nr:hypothetical protein [Pseudomonadota bacterium]